MNILLADDEKEVIEQIKKLLETKGYNIDIAFDGSRALDLIKIKDYNLVIVDHNMPELTGLELIKYVKQNGLKTKTAMITGYSPMRDFFAKDMGADEYITKPYSLKDIENVIAKYAPHPNPLRPRGSEREG